jgi:hypothetical protein
MRRLRQGVLLVESIQASIAQPMDQEIDHRSPNHQRHSHVFVYDNRGDTLLANREGVAKRVAWRVLQPGRLCIGQHLDRNSYRLPRTTVSPLYCEITLTH